MAAILFNAAVFFNPDAAKAFKRPGFDIECGKRPNQDGFQVGDVAADTADARAIRRFETQDWIADELAGAVVGDITAAVNVIKRDAPFARASAHRKIRLPSPPCRPRV